MATRVFLAATLASLVSVTALAQEFPAPRNLGNPERLGLGVQRTMTLLETSTPERHNTVKILLYGQSITAGNWGVKLQESLRERYPHANLIYERRPLSGFSTERLVKTAEFDLYPYYADLVIFHDYGNDVDYETMIRKLREQTTSEVIIQADHFRRSEQLIDETRPVEIESTKQRWAAQRNSHFLPTLARRYGCGFDGRRDLWREYLMDFHLAPGDLVKDDVHPNEHGTYLMTELIKAYLVRRSDTQIDPMNCGYVATHLIDDVADINGDSLDFEFHGNRVDVVFRDDASGGCTAMIDGHRPLDDVSMFYHGRNRVKWRETPIPPGPWPPVLKMSFESPLVAEQWTLHASRDPATSDAYTFTVVGTVTGEDGSGRTDERFVSKSGRVVIEADDWDVQFAIVALRRLTELPSDFQIDWNVETQAVNEVVPPEPEQGVERTVTVAQRLSDGRHTLRLTGNLSGIRGLRVYSPNRFPRDRLSNSNRND